MVELLAPAGNFEKLKVAFYYGADACYFAGKKYGLRAFSDNFDLDELSQSVEYAHSLNKKCYITLNILAHNTDFDELKDYVVYLEKIKVDGVIVSDMGILQFIKTHAPKLSIHISTQANITNKYSAKFFTDLGADRLVLARELSLEEIKEIRDYIPSNVELECFVHGAMCISYSGRCLLSNYMSGRNSNCGACVQSCRWEYSIIEKNRLEKAVKENQPINSYGIEQDNRGTYILNSKDLCMIEYINKLKQVGVTSFKIEGRMKSPYYVATIVNAYRRAINLMDSNDDYVCPNDLLQEVSKASHRGYTSGFYFKDNNKEDLVSSLPFQTHDFIAIVLDYVDGYAVVEMRNKFVVGDKLEILSPNDEFNKILEITSMCDMNGNDVQVANQVQQILKVKCDYKLQAGDILRKKSN